MEDRDFWKELIEKVNATMETFCLFTGELATIDIEVNMRLFHMMDSQAKVSMRHGNPHNITYRMGAMPMLICRLPKGTLTVLMKRGK
jgi:hypothetical protein